MVVEVLGRDLEPVDEIALRTGSSRDIPLDPGLYFLRTALPSGQMATRSFEAPASGIETVALDLGAYSPHESREWAFLTQPLAHSAATLEGPRARWAWMRLWRREGDAWSVVPIAPANAEWEPRSAVYTIELDQAPHMLQVGGREAPWKCIALPAQRLRVMVRPAEGPAEMVHPLEVSVASMDPAAESLLGYLRRGATREARLLLDNDGEAKALLYGKVSNPCGAAIGGYYMLRTGELEEFAEWVANLANWIDWLPDGAVIHAWLLITRARRSAEDRSAQIAEARERLIEAVGRGIPVYTEGLRLLHSGLQIFDAEAKGKDAEVAAALARVARTADAADWTTSTTTYTGAAPEQPSLRPILGLPQDDAPIAYVYDVPYEELAGRDLLPIRGLQGAVSAVSREDARDDFLRAQFQAPTSALHRPGAVRDLRARIPNATVRRLLAASLHDQRVSRAALEEAARSVEGFLVRLAEEAGREAAADGRKTLLVSDVRDAKTKVGAG